MPRFDISWITFTFIPAILALSFWLDKQSKPESKVKLQNILQSFSREDWFKNVIAQSLSAIRRFFSYERKPYRFIVKSYCIYGITLILFFAYDFIMNPRFVANYSYVLKYSNPYQKITWISLLIFGGIFVAFSNFQTIFLLEILKRAKSVFRILTLFYFDLALTFLLSAISLGLLSAAHVLLIANAAPTKIQTELDFSYIRDKADQFRPSAAQSYTYDGPVYSQDGSSDNHLHVAAIKYSFPLVDDINEVAKNEFWMADNLVKEGRESGSLYLTDGKQTLLIGQLGWFSREFEGLTFLITERDKSSDDFISEFCHHFADELQNEAILTIAKFNNIDKNSLSLQCMKSGRFRFSGEFSYNSKNIKPWGVFHTVFTEVLSGQISGNLFVNREFNYTSDIWPSYSNWNMPTPRYQEDPMSLAKDASGQLRFDILAANSGLYNKFYSQSLPIAPISFAISFSVILNLIICLSLATARLTYHLTNFRNLISLHIDIEEYPITFMAFSVLVFASIAVTIGLVIF